MAAPVIRSWGYADSQLMDLLRRAKFQSKRDGGIFLKGWNILRPH